MDTSIPLGAAIEHNTFAPLIAALHLGGDDTFSSPIERIFVSTNGAQDCANPQRQGLSAGLADGFRPNNVVGAEYLQMHWITVRHGMLNCSNGHKMRSMVIEARCLKNSRF
jgi:hypothetical protein